MVSTLAAKGKKGQLSCAACDAEKPGQEGEAGRMGRRRSAGLRKSQPVGRSGRAGVDSVRKAATEGSGRSVGFFESAIYLASVSYVHHHDDKHIVSNLINNPIVPHSDSIKVIFAAELLDAVRPRVISQCE